ncbi:hypothetical protein HK101_003321, partial [Irineochytrium annulatum]
MSQLLMQGNAFNGAIPSWLGAMQNLQYLDLSMNRFYGNLPSFLPALEQIET